MEKKLETLVVQNVFEGKGVNKVYYGQCENGELSPYIEGKNAKIAIYEFWYDMWNVSLFSYKTTRN